MNRYSTYFNILLCASIFFFFMKGFAQFNTLGNGSYTTTFPGVDASNRNAYPTGTPQISNEALQKPVPTNDWWSKLIKEDHADNLFNYPLALKTINEGLIVSYIVPPSNTNGSVEPIGASQPIIVGVQGLDASRATVSDYSDWTVTMDWNDTNHHIKATAGIAMPFIYFEKSASDTAQVTINQGQVTIYDEMLLIIDASQGADFAIYAPQGSVWNKTGNTYTSQLNGKDYWSMAYLPPVPDVENVAIAYKENAYVFPANTTVDWNYNPDNGALTTTFNVIPEVKEGTGNTVILGLLPHQWSNLALDSPQPESYSYASIRGEIKTLIGNTFKTQNTFHGILPTLPKVAQYSPDFDLAALHSKIAQIENDGLPGYTDSYNEGQLMNRLIQTARIANQLGKIEARDKLIATVKQRLEDWLTATAGEVSFLFYYNSDWTALIGYPAGHGQDYNLNDHHFHWGYFIHAAAFMEQYEPGWADAWGEMVNLLVRDAAAYDRSDPLFPFLRNFSPYAGHSWANGFATFPFGNDQESTSESMQFNSSLIHWGTITNNDTIRDLGIYLYTTEQKATEEYWFDVHNRIFKPEYGYSLASRIWGNGYDNQTFWTSDIAASYGIEMYPIHGGSLYLGHHPEYVTNLWNEITANTEVLNNQENANLWYDVYWQYLSFVNPQAAIDLYNAYPTRSLKFGISDAQTYHWLHAMNVLGQVDTSITANYPMATVFDNDGNSTYVAHNYSNVPITVHFSDGYKLEVPPSQMATSNDLQVTGVLESSFSQASINGSVQLQLTPNGEAISSVAFYDGGLLLGEVASPPYQWTAGNLAPGSHEFTARIYVGTQYNFSNTVTVQVGEQVSYFPAPVEIPGVVEAGYYDIYEGGNGQGVTYLDTTTNNEGGFRAEEYVDAVLDTSEGANVGWIEPGEWMEYTVDVKTAGIYEVTCRFASGNPNGGGPFYFELDGVKISPEISFNTTGGWGVWQDKIIHPIELTAGEHILRVVVTGGQFNLGKMTFNYTSPLPYDPPLASAGDDLTLSYPVASATLDASQSYFNEDQNVSFQWEQIYGPTTVSFDTSSAAITQISNLDIGVYKFQVTVDDGTYQSADSMLLVVSATSNTPPTVTLTNPQQEAVFLEGTTIELTAEATDLDGSITLVEFFDGSTKIGTDTAPPFSFSWVAETPGTHQITTVATDNLGATSVSDAVAITIEANDSECPEDSLDFDSDGVPDLCDDDIDGDGVLNTYDQCPNTVLGVVTDVFGCTQFNLPYDNFTIQVKQTSCVDRLDGSLEISVANQTLDYVMTISGFDTAIDLNTTNGYNQIVDGLAPGIYEICFAVVGIENYAQCSTITVATPAPLSTYSQIDKSEGTVTYMIHGATEYYIALNGNVKKYDEPAVTLKLKNGQNRIQIFTDKACQGVLEDEIFVSEEVLYYPNPTNGPLQLFIPESENFVELTLANVYGSVLKHWTEPVPWNSVVRLDLHNLAMGVYLLRVKNNDYEQTIKIVKQ